MCNSNALMLQSLEILWNCTKKKYINTVRESETEPDAIHEYLFSFLYDALISKLIH